MSSRQNEPDSMLARSENPLTTRNAASQPPRSAAIAPRRTRSDGDEPGERRPLDEPLAPEELAELVHLLAPVIEVQVEVAVEVELDRERARPRREPGLLERERRDLAEPAHLPEEQDEQRRRDRDAAREPLAPAASDDVREQRAGRDEQVRRLQRRRRRR